MRDLLIQHWLCFRDFAARFFRNDLSPDQKKKTFSFFLCAIFVAILYFTVWIAPSSFPVEGTVTITQGATLSEIAEYLEEKDIVKSSFVLRSLVTVLGGEKAVFAGDYFFQKKESVFSIARMLTKGDFGFVPLSITIPEGATNAEMAVIFEKRLYAFDSDLFLALAKKQEGYLFPDTYFFLPNAEAEEVAQKLRDTFLARIGEIQPDIFVFGKSLDDVVIMASLLEKEARTTESRRIIAGILWKRIAIGMPLQVDAVFNYINSKGTSQLTLEDLAIDSPYNTYKYRGLPVGPIANPGLDALRAAVTPIETDYLFYLSDKEGNMHYSRTFEEHKIKKAKYVP